MICEVTKRAAAWLAVTAALCAPAGAAEKDLFANGSFEMGQASWGLDKGGGTVASFKVERGEAADGRYSAAVTIGKVEEWGVQFGQRMAAPARGKTYTLAAAARSLGSPVTVRVEIERAARPWDRATRSDAVTVTKDQWTELHVTFTIEKDFKEGWFAYLSCAQANSRFRVDAFRLYEGKYVPYTEVAREVAAVAAPRLFDTTAASAKPLSAEALTARKGWAQIPADKPGHAFKGDAVLTNDRMAVVFRRGAAGAEVYSMDKPAAKLRAVLAPTGGEARISAVKVPAEEPDAGEAAVEAAFALSGGKSATIGFALAMRQVYVRATPRDGAAAGLLVRAPCRFAVLPDFFADDIVVDAAQLPASRAELPADNLLLHMSPGRDAIVMAVRDVVTGDVNISLAGSGADKTIASTEVPFGKGGKVWVAVLAGEGIWHCRDVAAADTGKIIALDWAAPLSAAWRMDWRKADGLTGSWPVIAERSRGGYDKYGVLGPAGTLPANRKRWTTVLGSFLYPCWLDRGGRGHIQPLRNRAVRFEGPALIYPIARTGGTPIDAFTMVDIVRATLGVGPCEYILDVEGQRNVYKGIATCGCRDTLNPIYQKGSQRSQRAKVEKTLTDVVIFIRFIRQRIEEYVAFGNEMKKYLAERKAADPELAEQIATLESALRMIDERFAARRARIRVPADAQKLADEFRRTLLDYEGPDAYKKCRQFTSAWVSIGSNQDELVGECRLAVKVLRQRAVLAAAAEPRMAEIAREIRRRSHKVLRNPASHEGANH